MLRDIISGTDKQVSAVVAVVKCANPDILVLAGLDYDQRGAAVSELARQLNYPFVFSPKSNRGVQSGFDMNGDGKLGTPNDAQGYAHFLGQSSLAVFSKIPIVDDGVKDFTKFLWRDLPDGDLPTNLHRSQRLGTTGHWDVPVALADGRLLHLLIWHATPPVFDGPEDFNGRRNHDEAAFWLHYLNGELGNAAPDLFVMAGAANLDPFDGDGKPDALNQLLTHPLIYDPRPKSLGGKLAKDVERGVNLLHAGNPALDTANWRDDPGPGNLRVDYVLPARKLPVINSAVFWPDLNTPWGQIAHNASRHRLVWVDLKVPTR